MNSITINGAAMRNGVLLTPGTGVCKPTTVRRRDTNRRWRQVTKLPRPFPQ